MMGRLMAVTSCPGLSYQSQKGKGGKLITPPFHPVKLITPLFILSD